MNMDYPHELMEQVPHGDHGRHFLPVTLAEAAQLSTMSSEERGAWLAAIPTKERLARVLEREGLSDLADLARSGKFDDFDDGGLELPQVALVRQLYARGRRDLCRRVQEGEWDATMAESDAWTAKQTGETRRLLDAMGGPKRPPSSGRRNRI